MTTPSTDQNDTKVAPDNLKASLMLHVVDGARQPLSTDKDLLVRLTDGTQKQVYQGFINGPDARILVPFSDGPANHYGITVSAKAFKGTGAAPIRLSPSRVSAVAVMLLPKGGSFNFANARWKAVRQAKPQAFELLCAGAETKVAAQDRYEMLMEKQSPAAACLWNILTASQQLLLPGGSIADHLKQLIWDKSMAQDRVFAFADRALIQQVVEAAKVGMFEEEKGLIAKLFHKGATLSYKQTQFNEANLQITFHEGTTMRIGETDCVKVELDMDYFRDVGSHGVLEVLPNTVKSLIRGERHGKTDPREIYRLRWMAARNSVGVPEFDVPYTIS